MIVILNYNYLLKFVKYHVSEAIVPLKFL